MRALFRAALQGGIMTHYVKLFRVPLFTLALITPAMLPSFIIALFCGEKTMCAAFAISAGAALALNVPVFLSFRRKAPHFQARDGFFTVSMTWFLLAFWGALPYYLSGIDISFTNAVFESASGFATTGAVTIADIEALPRSLLFWRSTSYWIGGMGIILLTVALLPLLGVGGFQLVKAETGGPEKEKITPKMTETAKTLWLFYCALTCAAAALYKIGGMDLFDALCHAFTTLATGGASTKNGGIASYNSPFINAVSAVFLFLGAVNFNLYYRLLCKNFKEVFYNSEFRAYLAILAAAAAALALSLYPYYGTAGGAISGALLQTVSALSTSGTVFFDYSAWPAFAQTLLFLLFLLGGCSGSTAGGVKLVRYVVLCKQAGNEMRRLLHPRGVFSVQLNHKVGRKDVVYGVAGFLFLYMLMMVFTALATAAAGFDLVTSISAGVVLLSNIGTGFGATGPGTSYALFPAYLKWIYIFVMIAGRLELTTVLILFKRDFWRSI
jgi:trk system potassium uptake protein TrkH